MKVWVWYARYEPKHQCSYHGEPEICMVVKWTETGAILQGPRGNFFFEEHFRLYSAEVYPTSNSLIDYQKTLYRDTELKPVTEEPKS